MGLARREGGLALTEAFDWIDLLFTGLASLFFVSFVESVETEALGADCFGTDGLTDDLVVVASDFKDAEIEDVADDGALGMDEAGLTVEEGFLESFNLCLIASLRRIELD